MTQPAEPSADGHRDEWKENPDNSLKSSSIDDLFSRLLKVRTSENWIFRGQASAQWDLRSSLERRLQSLPPGRSPASAERGVHRRFMERAGAHIGDLPSEDDELGWLMLMQHYGAPTRLLDWTRSPFVGLYFAYEQSSANRQPAALWCMSAGAIRFSRPSRLFLHLRDPWVLFPDSSTDCCGNETVTFPGVDFDWRSEENANVRQLRTDRDSVPYLVLPPRLTDRMAAQQAVFTYDGALAGGIPYTDPRLQAKRFLLPADWRIAVLERLRTMGVSAASLFPGLDGIGRAAGLSVDLQDELEDQVGF